MKKKLCVVLFFLSLMFLFTACGTTEIDMNKYVDFSFSGYEYVGNATSEVDVRQMLLDNEDCFGFDRKALKSGDGEDVLEDLEDAFKVKLDKIDGYKNGDKVPYSWDVDDDILEDIADEYKVLFLYDDSDIKVSGLDESTDINPFDDLYVDFWGRNGAGCVNYLDCYDYYLGYYIDDDMTVSKTEELSNGDVITVSLSDELIKEYRTYGYNPNPVSKEIIVEGLAVPQVVDAFSGIEVEFSGNSPYVTANVNIWYSDYYYQFDFSYDTRSYYANGDVFEITLTESGMQHALEYYNLIPEATSKTFIIDRPEAPTVINVMSFTDEVPKMVEKYIAMHPEKNIQLRTTIIATTDGMYQPALDAALVAGGADAPDIYAVEAAFALKYTQGDASGFAAAYEDLGIDMSKVQSAEIAPYSVEIGTRPADGKIVGLGYQATGGAFIYRRSIAKDVWGADDPYTIKAKIGGGSGSWDQFWVAAEELKDKGYAIISGDGDLWRAVENSSPTGWVVDGSPNMDSKREEFLDLSKKLMDNGYHNDTQDWNDAWFADMKGEGDKEVLGFFGPAWLINYTIAANCGGSAVGEGTYGDWAVCESPVGFFWGGTWLLANKDTTKKEIVADILEWITLDDSETGLQYMWANGTFDSYNNTKDCVASGTVMAKSNGTLDFLGGQNMFEVFIPANAFANGKNLTPYDEDINYLWRTEVRNYTAGNKTRDDAIADFKTNVNNYLNTDPNREW